MVLQQMKRARSLFLPIMLIAVFAFATPAAGQPNNSDSLLLTGVVMNIDRVSKKVVVDVKTLGCTGTKTFIMDDMSSLRARTGEKIDFYIASDHCPASQGSKMLWPRRIK